MSVESRRFGEGIREHFAELNRTIEELTEHQFQILRFLHGRRRVAVAGCAGSGKTLLATEKARRCAHAGLRTLMLCHSPHLARTLRSMLRGSAVDVSHLAEWTASLVPDPLDRGPSSSPGWTHYDEPSDHVLGAAFDRLTDVGPRYDAIVVDEGQDFRDSSWLVVEAALADEVNSLLYVFYDDNQTLIPRDWKQPFDEVPYTLTRNLRNCGEIFQQVRAFHPQEPSGSPALEREGWYLQTSFRRGQESEAIKAALEFMAVHGPGLDRCVVLTTEPDATASVLEGFVATVGAPPWPWQDRVEQHLLELKRSLPPRLQKGFVMRSGFWPSFSRGRFPSHADINFVTQLCRRLSGLDATSGRHGPVLAAHTDSWGKVRWGADGRLAGPAARRWRATLDFFMSGEWATSLGRPTWRVSSRAEHGQEGAIPLYTIGAFKGLEADGVVVFVRGYSDALRTQLYVAFSRARLALYALLESEVVAQVPQLARNLDATRP